MTATSAADVRRTLDDILRSPAELQRLRGVISGGGVVALPTETFYALGADPRNEGGIARIFELKGRDDGKPLLVLFSKREDLGHLGVSARGDLLDRFFRIWPAPVTVVLPIASPIAASRGTRTLGVRMPAAPRLRELLDAIGPVTGTSANLSGSPPLSSPDAVWDAFGGSVDLLVDGGATPAGEPSTVLDATVDPPRVLRAGAFAWKDDTH